MAEETGSMPTHGSVRPPVADAWLNALPVGTRIDKYEIASVLGQGGFGITYRAVHAQLGLEVAIKEYLPASFAIRQPNLMVLPNSTRVADDFRWGRERFLAEAKTLARLKDAAGIVRVHDFLEAHGTAYMVMALVVGETLEARLNREGRLSPAAVARLLPPLLDGLEKVHAADFLHRDIKPANILIGDDGLPTLIDFGASRVAVESRTRPMTAIYTLGYAAYEQLISARQGPWTDIYALGATLYHAVTGAPPPNAIERMGEDRMVPALQAGRGAYAPELLAAIDAALQLKSPQRPQSIADWRRLLALPMPKPPDAAEGTPTVKVDRRPHDPAAPPAPVAGRRRPLRIAAGLVALGLVAGGGWFAVRELAGPDTAVAGTAASRTEDEAWAAARKSGTLAGYRAFAAKFPKGRYAAEAGREIAALEQRDRQDAARRTEDEAWARARSAGTVAAYRAYLDTWPTGRYAVEAGREIAALEQRAGQDAARRADDEAWTRARSAGTVAAYRAYLDAWPTGRHAAEAGREIAALEQRDRQDAARRAEDEAWARAQSAGTVAAWQAYVDAWPTGRYAAEARQSIERVRADEAAWRQARAADTEVAYQAYRDAWPAGRFAADAGREIERLRRVPPAPTAPADTRPPVVELVRRDCPACPAVRRIAPGSFTMGSGVAEQQREDLPKSLRDRERPQVPVRLETAFWIGIHEVTRGEFAAFERATGRSSRNACFDKVTFGKTDSEPAICVTWEEAVAYAEWLSDTTGKAWRLPTEAEWEFAARGGAATARYWGDDDQDMCKYANVDDKDLDCRDGFRNTAPVGRLAPNAFGLHDMLGNVWEWTADCWNDSHDGAPADGTARTTGDCRRHVLRGGSWSAGPRYARAATRGSAPTRGRQDNVGFRVVRGD